MKVVLQKKELKMMNILLKFSWNVTVLRTDVTPNAVLLHNNFLLLVTSS